MVELVARSPGQGRLPITIGGMELSEVDPGHLTALSPLRGQKKALAGALKAAHGMAWPAPGRMTGKEGARALWFGLDHVMLMGPEPDAALGKFGAVTDQSDAWAVVALRGPLGAEVLARLVPVDLRGAVFKRGHTARTDLMHMSASITRTGPETLMIMVFRSMFGTLLHDLKGAMQGVAARRVTSGQDSALAQ